ncbi:MAG: nucleoside-diphosphate sugar epimerase [Rhodospirillaceae bacterium]|nr:nucleoside-diphosphate sugar epimerase [Rhodospirillaceae bacterium]MBT4589789.1 nucleoside-diphosphate sugar epimerase [Rhodospirillaceae bacterium]MBT7268182.1 nucleoside-diphosphate sugar epimerase [Rhodospirillaceae bacterium]
MNETPVIWALIDERPGTGNQCSAVAKALELPFEEKQLIWSSLANLPNFLMGPSLRGLTAASKSELESPWPDVVIASGRRGAAVARYIKKQSLDDCCLVHIMYPGDTAISEFDLVAVPNHDGAVKNNGNIIRITGAPHGIDDIQLSRARMRWQAKFTGLKQPLFGLIVGGATKRRPFTSAMAEELGRQTGDLVAGSGGSLLITTSPRTGDALAGVLSGLSEKNVKPDYVYRWAAGGSVDDNPYLGFLAHADQLIVTGESSSMCSEVCASGKPVHIFAPDGFLGDKHRRLVDELVAEGYAQVLGMEPEATPSPAAKKLDVAAQIAAEIQKRILPELELDGA